MTAADEVVFTVVGPTGMYTISAAEHAHWAEIAHRSGAPRREALLQAFEQLVHFTWLEAEAAERGLALSDEVVQQELLASRRETFPDAGAFQRFLHETGQTAADFEWRVRQHLLSEAIRTDVMSGVAASVNDAMVEDHIAEHGLEQVRERRDVRLVLTERKATALTAKRELLRGTSSESVASRYSIDEDTHCRAGERPPAGLCSGTVAQIRVARWRSSSLQHSKRGSPVTTASRTPSSGAISARSWAGRQAVASK
jgi:SurA N-terminal domain